MGASSNTDYDYGADEAPKNDTKDGDNSAMTPEKVDKMIDIMNELNKMFGKKLLSLMMENLYCYEVAWTAELGWTTESITLLKLLLNTRNICEFVKMCYLSTKSCLCPG